MAAFFFLPLEETGTTIHQILSIGPCNFTILLFVILLISLSALDARLSREDEFLHSN